jgi:uncharacterized membrane protein
MTHGLYAVVILLLLISLSAASTLARIKKLKITIPRKIIAGILRISLGWNIIYILDLILMLFNGKILRLLNC